MDETLLFDPRGFEDPSDKLVYHFTKFTTARDHILGGNRQILANMIAKMNDPFEHAPKRLPLSWNTTDDIDEDLAAKAHQALYDATVSNARLFCCSLDVPAIKHFHPDGPIYIRFNRRGFDHPSMWTHYAENHCGVCLIFYRERLDTTFRERCKARELKVMAAPVGYERLAATRLLRESDWRVTPVINGMTPDILRRWAREKISTQYKLFYFTKHDDWTPESEYRWLILGDYDDDLFIPLKGDELAAVVLGSNFPLADHERVSKLCDDWKVPLRAMVWTNGESNHPVSLSMFRDSGFWEQRERDAVLRRRAGRTLCAECSRQI